MATDQVVTKLLDELQKKKREINEIYNTLQMLKKYGANIELPEGGLDLGIGQETPGTNLTIRPDEFYGITNTDAAEKYLKKIGHAKPLDDIYNALIEGGMKFTGDGKKSLYVQLIRATRKFTKIGSGKIATFGLNEWYPKMKRAATKVKETEEEQVELTPDNSNEPEKTTEE